MRGEYLHVDFGGVSTTAIAGTAANNNPVSTTNDLAADVVRGAIIFKF